MPKNVPRSRPTPDKLPTLLRKRAAPVRPGFGKRTWQGWIGWAVRWLAFWFFTISIGWVVLLKWVPVPFTPTMLDRKFGAVVGGRASEIHYDWTRYDALSYQVALAVVAAEDQRFPVHYGFDFEAMEMAFRNNMKGKRMKGASTISQQVAKNVFLWQGRDYFRKALEAWFTLLIETIWGKERILEVYLNVAETGPMTFGVEAASQRFYGHPASQLTRTEAARMAAVLPSPNRFSIAHPSAYVERRTRFIARQMGRLGKSHVASL